MNPARWADVLYTWGLVVFGIIVFLILTGLPFAFIRGC